MAISDAGTPDFRACETRSARLVAKASAADNIFLFKVTWQDCEGNEPLFTCTCTVLSCTVHDRYRFTPPPLCLCEFKTPQRRRARRTNNPPPNPSTPRATIRRARAAHAPSTVPYPRQLRARASSRARTHHVLHSCALRKLLLRGLISTASHSALAHAGSH